MAGNDLVQHADERLNLERVAPAQAFMRVYRTDTRENQFDLRNPCQKVELGHTAVTGGSVRAPQTGYDQRAWQRHFPLTG